MVQMPAGGEGGDTLDILVQDPGSPSAPVLGGDTIVNGAYYEWRGRPIRLETLAADGATGGFVPRTRLGLKFSIVEITSGTAGALPGVQLSASLASLASTDAGPTINIPAFADPSGEPVIRLRNSADSAEGFFMVSVEISEAKDEDRSPQGT